MPRKIIEDPINGIHSRQLWLRNPKRWDKKTTTVEWPLGCDNWIAGVSDYSPLDHVVEGA